MYFHSLDWGVFVVATTPRWEENASHNMKINKVRLTKEIMDPIDETTFHFVIVSG